MKVFYILLSMQLCIVQFSMYTFGQAKEETHNDSRKPGTKKQVDACDIVKKLEEKKVDGFFRDTYVCMAEALSQRDTSLVKKTRTLHGSKPDPCHQYTFGLFQIPNSWCTSDDHEEYSKCAINGCNIDCLNLLDDDISDDVVCIRTISKLRGLNSEWPPMIVNECRWGVETNKWNFTECLKREQSPKNVTNIPLWAALLIVAVVSLVVFALTYFFYKYRRNSHSVLSNNEIKDFKYGRIRGIASMINRPPTIRVSHVEESFTNQPYDNQYEVSPDDFVIDKNHRLGSGAYGVVFKAMCRGQIVAAKTVSPEATREYFQSLLGEIKILTHVGRHNCILNLEGAYTKELQKGIVYVFMEYCGMGNLESFLRKNRNKFVTMEEFSLRNADDELKFDNADTDLLEASREVNCITIKHLLQYAQQIAKGMEFLSSKEVIHGDLAARNILLVDENTAKISDFGLSRKLYGYVQYIKKKEEPLPWRWMAIESLREMNFSTFSDVWMYSVLLSEIFSLGEVPYPGMSYSLEFVDKLENGFRMLAPKHAPVGVYKDVMLKCWETVPSKRPSFFDLSNYFYLALTNITSTDYTEVREIVDEGDRRGASHI